jgi:hypothetical protein
VRGIPAHLTRLAALVVLGLALFGGFSLASAKAASFDDTKPCPTTAQFFTCPTGEVGKAYDVQLIGKGGCDLYWFEVVNSTLPAGLTMNTSGRIQGVPASAGRSEVYIHIHDLLPSQGGYPWCGGDNVSQKQFAFNIETGFQIVQNSVKNATVGQPYSEPLKAQRVTSTNPFTGTDTTATWSLASGNLPPGINLTAAGVLEGTPTAEGAYQFVVRAQSGGQSHQATYNISVKQPVVVSHPFSATTPPKSEVGVDFSATLTAAGGTGTYTWALASGTLPAGVVFTPPDAAATTTTTATIAGTPTQAGRYTFSVTATDSEGRVTTLNATLIVNAELAFRSPATLKPAKVGKAYKMTVKTTGGAAPVKWKLLRGKLPKGIKFAKLTGTFVGKPKKAGTYRVTLQVTDSLGVKTQQVFTLVVRP